MSDVDLITQKFGRKGVSFQLGQQGLPQAVLRAADGSSAEIYLHGAHLTSWKSPAGIERLFVSRKAIYAPDKPIRGGIPLVFPQFGTGTLPAHGIARTLPWQVIETRFEGESPAITLQLIASEATKSIWPHDFSLELSVSLKNKLHAEVSITNHGTSSFSFQWAFHTYFALNSIAQCRVRPLKGVRYLDSLRARESVIETAEELVIEKEVDRIYCQAPDCLEIVEGNYPRYTIEKRGLPDAVVWNPWTERSKAIADLEAEEYREFLCVECGLVEKPVLLAKGTTYSASMLLQSEDKAN